MDSLLYQVNRLKNMHPFISFVVLNQMNNNFTLRMDDLKKQKPIESDVYGSDQLLKLCDVLYIKVLPYKLGIRDKFMVFGKNSYPWLDEFKVSSGKDNVEHFDPLGVAYYFYLKRRNADPKDVEDVFAERLFKVEDMKTPPATDGGTITKPTTTPVFDSTPVFDQVTFNTSALTSARGGDFEDNEDEPF